MFKLNGMIFFLSRRLAAEATRRSPWVIKTSMIRWRKPSWSPSPRTRLLPGLLSWCGWVRTIVFPWTGAKTPSVVWRTPSIVWQRMSRSCIRNWRMPHWSDRRPLHDVFFEMVHGASSSDVLDRSGRACSMNRPHNCEYVFFCGVYLIIHIFFFCSKWNKTRTLKNTNKRQLDGPRDIRNP